jgi:hypothetical protein
MLSFASQSIGFWGPPQLRVMYRIERRPASPGKDKEYPQLPGQIEHGTETTDSKAYSA